MNVLQDAMMQEVDVPLCKSSVEHSFCSKDILGTFSKPKQEFKDTKDLSLFDDEDSGFTDILWNNEPCYHQSEKNRHIWDGNAFSAFFILSKDFIVNLNFGLYIITSL